MNKLEQISTLLNISLSTTNKSNPIYLFDILEDQHIISIYSDRILNQDLLQTLKNIFEHLDTPVIHNESLFHRALLSSTPLEITLLKKGFSSNSWVLAKINVTHQIEELVQLTLINDYHMTLIDSSYYLLVEEKLHLTVLSNLMATIETELMVKVQCFFTSSIIDLNQLSIYKKMVDEYQYVASKYHCHSTLISQNDLIFPLFIHHLSPSNFQQGLEDFCPLQTELLNDPEMMKTIECFLENHLNIAETSRALYIHRNTLLYRLEKLQSSLGLDLRDFHQAMKLSFYLYLSKR